jgi:tRNA-dihydrouridine synthase B
MKPDFSSTLYVLAPLAGWTDLPFRQTVKKFGVDLTVSEMISANALVYHSKKTFKMIEKSTLEEPYSVQIAGSDSETIKRAVDELNKIDGIDGIDLNCGCPAPKIVKNGSGSTLLKDLDLLEKIVQTIKQESDKSYTSVKMRVGFDKKYGADIAQAIESGGADFLAVHGRTRSGGYKSIVDYDEIAKVKASVSIPVIANGDITSYEIAQNVLEITKADGLMIGRGAMGNPWIFKQLKEGKSELSNIEKSEIILEHFDNMIEFHGEHGATLFRKHLHNYSKGYSGASLFRDTINRISESGEARDKIVNFFT